MRTRNRKSADAPKDANAELDGIVRAAQHGDEQAIAELYTRYAGMVYRIASSRLTYDDSADVVQDVFVRVLRELKTLRSTAAFGSWLVTIARNAVHDAARQARPTVALEREQLQPETQHEEMDARAAVRAIRSLPVAYRQTLVMRLVKGMTGPEIAKRTGMTAASVRVNLHRGMKLLREHLAIRSYKRPA